MKSRNRLGYFRISTEVQVPKFATDGSAAFDLRLFLDGSPVEAFNEFNEVELVEPYKDDKLAVMPGWRYKLPTGIIYDIPEGFWLAINMRGGTALKKGLQLCNSTGIVDWDYVQETFVCVYNATKSIVILEDGERIAQAKLETIVPTEIVESSTPPGKKTQRDGGFNSTGIS